MREFYPFLALLFVLPAFALACLSGRSKHQSKVPETGAEGLGNPESVIESVLTQEDLIRLAKEMLTLMKQEKNSDSSYSCNASSWP